MTEGLRFFNLRLGLVIVWHCVLIAGAWAEQPPPAPSDRPLPIDEVLLMAGRENKPPLPVLVHEVKGEMTREQRKSLTRVLEDALFRYPILSVYTKKEFINQLGWERQNEEIDCQLPKDCLHELKRKLGLGHEVELELISRADGQLNLKLRLIVGEEGRLFVESIPEFSAAPVVLEKIIPDLIGQPSGISFEEGVVHVASFPMGAGVYVGGRLVGRTPCSLRADGGSNMQITAEREGHPAVTETVSVPGGKVLRWFADLVTRQGDILVDSNPPGATVSIDKKPRGVTPLIVRGVLAGEHKIRLEMPPYPEAEYTVSVKADELSRVRHGFRPDSGILVLGCANKVRRRNVDIYLDGLKVAENTYRAELLPGRYTVHIVQDGYVTHEEEVNLESGKTLSLRPTLEEGLSLRPGEVAGTEPDYRPGAFSTAFGAIAVGFGAYLEIEAQEDYRNADDPGSSDSNKLRTNGRNTRIGGAILMAAGSAAVTAGVVLLILPPEREIAVTPAVDPENKQAGLNIAFSF